MPDPVQPVEPTPTNPTPVASVPKEEGLPGSVADVLAGRADPSTLSNPQPPSGEGTPPGEGEGGEPGKPGEEKADPTKVQDPPPGEVKEEDLAARLGFSESTEQKALRLEREYSASSKEAKRLNQVNEAVAKILKDQRIDLAVEDGLPVGLLMGEGYSKNADISVAFDKLPYAEQALFENNPQAAVDLVLDRARKGLTRVAPTLDRAPVSLSQERKAAAINHVANMVEVGGEKRHPNFETNFPFIDRMIQAPNTPKALREFIAQEPEMAFELLSMRVDTEKAVLVSQAQKSSEAKQKEIEESRQALSPAPAGGGAPSMTDDKGVSDYWGKKIANAVP